MNPTDYPVPINTIKTSVGDYGDWASVVQLAFMEPQLSGRHPIVRVVTNEAAMSNLPNGATDILPPGAQVIRDIKSKGVSASLAVVGDAWVYTTITRSGSRAVISGAQVAEVETIAQAINDAFPEPPKPDETTVPVHGIKAATGALLNGAG